MENITFGQAKSELALSLGLAAEDVTAGAFMNQGAGFAWPLHWGEVVARAVTLRAAAAATSGDK